MSRIFHNKISNFGWLIAITLIFTFLPGLSFAKELNEGKTGITYECVDAECDFQDLLNAVKKVMDYAVKFTLFFSVVVIAYAGYLYMISGANPAKRTEANKMLQKVLIGIFFILASWMIVSLILRALGVDSPVAF